MKRRIEVLILEDSEILRVVWKNLAEKLVPQSKFFFAKNTKQAEKYLEEKGHPNIIVLDFHLEEEISLPFLERTRPFFKGLMIANSVDRESNQILLEKGCDFQSRGKEIFPLLATLIN